MFKYIEKLREKPDRTKKQIDFLASFALAGIIFVIWFSVIYPDFKQRQSKETAASKLSPSPISTFGFSFASSIAAIGDQFNKMKELISSFSSDPIYYNATTSAVSSTTAEEES